MNLLILYDLLLLFYHFIRTWSRGKWNFVFYFTNGHAGLCIYLYIRIDRLTYRFTPEIFLQIVAVSTPMAMFYSEE